MSKQIKKTTISAIIIAKNEEQMLEACLKTISWCDEIIVVDSGSTDNTNKIAENYSAKVISFEHSSFARLREEGAKRAKGNYLLYIDADERILPKLAKEIQLQLELHPNCCLQIKRLNICYGQQFNFGGWQTDFVTRIFPKNKLRGWQGIIHESPVCDAPKITLKQQLIHLTHRNTAINLQKSAQWTQKEALLLYKADVAKINFFTLIRKGFMEFFRRAVLKKGYKDGLAGLIEALVQGINRVFVYIQVWELQQKPNLPKRYQEIEKKINNEWAKVKRTI